MTTDEFNRHVTAARKRIASMDKHDGRMVCDPGTIWSALHCGLSASKYDFKDTNADAVFDALVMLEQARKILATETKFG